MRPTNEMNLLAENQRQIFTRTAPTNGQERKEDSATAPGKPKLRYSYGPFSDFTGWLESCVRATKTDNVVAFSKLPYKAWLFGLAIFGPRTPDSLFHVKQRICDECSNGLIILRTDGKKITRIRRHCGICGCFKTAMSQNHVANRMALRQCPIGKFDEFKPFIEWTEAHGYPEEATAMRRVSLSVITDPPKSKPCGCHG